VGLLFYIFINFRDPEIISGNKSSFEDIRLAILLSIPAEICFMLFSNSNSHLSSGHLLKMIVYILFFRATYVHTLFLRFQAAHNSGITAGNQLQAANQQGFMSLEPLARRKSPIFFNKGEKANNKLAAFFDPDSYNRIANFYLQTEAILDSLEQYVILLNKYKIVTMCNKAAEKLLNMNKNEIVGKSLGDLCALLRLKPHLDPDSPKFDISRYMYVNRKMNLHLSSNGKKRKVIVHISTILDVSGDTFGFIIVGTDITELNSTFEKALRQEKLAILGQLSAGIVHEVRNYLSTVKGRSQIIEAISCHETVKKHARNISKDVDDINHIMNEILFLARPQKNELKKVSISEMFRAIESMISSSSLIKGVNVEIRMRNMDKYILCDESQIKQVILNLCKNAVEVVENRIDARIVIESGYDEASDEIYIRVIDNGPGILPEHLDKIGTPFFTTKENGTGLGLCMCFKIIENHKGRISVDSEYGKGATFTVFLPCINDEENNLAEYSPAHP